MPRDRMPGGITWLGCSRPTTCSPLKDFVTETNTMPRVNGPNDDDPGNGNGTGTRTLNWKRPLLIATWNVLSLYRAGLGRNVVEEMKKYKVDIAALQEVRWPGTGECNINGFKGTVRFGGVSSKAQPEFFRITNLFFFRILCS